MSRDPMHLAHGPSQLCSDLSHKPSQLRSALRCGAKTRSGKPCQSPAVAGRARCRMHGGAKGSGGPSGARNGNYKHGRYTAETRATRKWIRESIREMRAIAEKVRELQRDGKGSDRPHCRRTKK